MQRAEFMQTLAEERCEDVVAVQREANGAFDSHAHPFGAKALILEGELVIRTDGVDHVYRAGDVFHLLAQVVHIEAVWTLRGQVSGWQKNDSRRSVTGDRVRARTHGRAD